MLKYPILYIEVESSVCFSFR